MVRKCAWCGEVMGEKKPMNDKSETHGMCPPCFEKQVAHGNPGAVLDETLLTADVTTRAGIDIINACWKHTKELRGMA